MDESQPFSQEVLQAASELGSALRQSPMMQAYLEACAAVEADLRARELEAEVQALADELTQRQAAGEMLSSAELDHFYRLRSEVRSNPLLAERDRCFELLRSLFSRVNDDLSGAMGINFSELLQPE
ncbi:MAG: YlbF family regulator [Anaerolineaceae bacterium]|nr:YlbF family regulator [Anaerolineaceae bacterium]